MTRYEEVQRRAENLNKQLKERGSNNFRYIVGLRYKLLRIPNRSCCLDYAKELEEDGLVLHNEQEEMDWISSSS